MTTRLPFKLHITVLLLLAAILASAQYPDTLWTRIHAITNDIDEGRCVRQTADGGYIITGSCVPNGTISHLDLLLLKTDSQGYMTWMKCFAIELVEEGFSVQQTFDGGYIIGGRALLITGPNPYTDNQSEIWLLKTDVNGDTVWTNTYGGNGHDYCTWVEQTSDSGYILTGTMNSGRSYPPNCFLEYTQSATEHAFLMKTDHLGEVTWTKTFQVGSYDSCVLQTADGGYVLAGMVVSNDQPDIYLVKTDSMGDTLWTQTIGRSDSLEFARAVREMSDGYVIAGHIGPMPVASVDGLVVKTDFSGQVLWMNNYDVSLSDVVNSIVPAPGGGYVAAGNANCQWHIHNGNMWVFGINSEGNMLWQRIYDIALNDYVWSCTKTLDSCYVVTGLLGYGFGGDLWLAKIGLEEGVGENSARSVRQNSIRIHPNPFHESTTISYVVAQPDLVDLEIYDMLGRRVCTLVREFKDAGNYSTNFEAENLPNGIYYCNVRVGANNLETKRMLLVR